MWVTTWNATFLEPLPHAGRGGTFRAEQSKFKGIVSPWGSGPMKICITLTPHISGYFIYCVRWLVKSTTKQKGTCFQNACLTRFHYYRQCMESIKWLKSEESRYINGKFKQLVLPFGQEGLERKRHLIKWWMAWPMGAPSLPVCYRNNLFMHVPLLCTPQAVYLHTFCQANCTWQTASITGPS